MQWLNKNIIKDVQMNDVPNATSIITVVPVKPQIPEIISEVPDFESKEKKQLFLAEQAAKRRLDQEQSERDARMKAEIEKLAQLKSKIIDEAQEQAKQLVLEAEKDSASLRELAYQEAFEQGKSEGYADGFSKGMNQALTEGEEIVETAQTNAKAILQMSQDYIVNKKEEWLEHIIEMAQALIQKQFELDEQTILSVLEPMWLEIEKPDSLLTIRTNPMHYNVLNEKMLSRKIETSHFRYVIIKEANYPPYRVEVESDEMLLTFDLEEELQHFLEKLKKDESNEL